MADVDWAAQEQRLKDEAARRGVTYDPSDLEGIRRNTSYTDAAGNATGMSLDQAVQNQFGIYQQRQGNAPGGSQPTAQSPAQQWNAQPAGTGSNELYSLLMDRAKQGTAVDRNDPNIRQQADAFSANTERSRRNYLSDVAEKAGPFANLQGEQRMAAERAGIASGTFEAELIGREQDARRQEIESSLQMWGHLMSADQTRALQMELAQLSDRARTADRDLARRGMDFSNDQFMRELALREFDTNNRWDYAWSGMGG